ncbi:hypothetical protein LEP1GSC008_0529 [Leptospira kirschneri serovar Bulgarica str. Nikolaevo]|uniref:Uncharacterized protein n=1 Tax=Leptospira kirschneri serovar Bulgarica str. Nikolaevo TaxID=1240687 RepID=M6F4I7_9LEPT|nr:hypothetical protein LEP1GSC008_0529 [Leptospira kirschneri serovar Bulgarica str. Nikolaevo]
MNQSQTAKTSSSFRSFFGQDVTGIHTFAFDFVVFCELETLCSGSVRFQLWHLGFLFFGNYFGLIITTICFPS